MELQAKNTTSMTSKGQVTIPYFVRQKLQLNPGDRFSWEVLNDGEIRIRKLDALEAARLTIGEEFRKQRITPEQLEELIEETRSKVSREYLQSQSKADE